MNDYLSFSVVNPSYPRVPITLRMLLDDTGSIGEPTEWLYNFESPGDYPLPLREYVRSLLDPAGERYDPYASYVYARPGTTYVYSNLGYCLIGVLVEELSGAPLDTWSEEHVFGPLGMNAHWFPSRFPMSGEGAPAMPYELAGREPVPLGHYGYPDWPAGQRRTDVRSLSTFLQAHLNRGAHGDVRLLAPETADRMITPSADQWGYTGLSLSSGLGFNVETRADGDVAVFHTGGDYGVSTTVEFHPEAGYGMALLANGALEGYPGEEDVVALEGIWDRLGEVGRGER